MDHQIVVRKKVSVLGSVSKSLKPNLMKVFHFSTDPPPISEIPRLIYFLEKWHGLGHLDRMESNKDSP
jgi:hypothetical protein